MTASEQFKRRLTPLKEMIALDASFDDFMGITKPDYRPLVEALRQSLGVLPVAFFEDFLRSLIEQFVDKLNSLEPRVQWRQLPLSLRRAHVFESSLSIRKAPPDGDDGSYQDRCMLDLKNILSKIISPIETPTQYIVAVEPLTNTNANPDHTTVNDMFKRIGIKDVFSHPLVLSRFSAINPVYSTPDPIRIKLNEIVEHRHGIAHGRTASILTRLDISNNLQFLENLSTILQEVASEKYTSIEALPRTS